MTDIDFVEAACSQEQSSACSPGPIDIWFAEISDTSIGYEQQTEHAISKIEASKLSRLGSSYKRREFLLSRALVRQALTYRFGLEENYWCFQQRSGYALEITNLPQPVFTSLSHSKGLIAFVISDYPVGVDLEVMKKERNIDGIAATTMCRDEIDYLNHIPDEKIPRFYEIWCSKEAIYKMLPEEEQAKTRLADIPVYLSGIDNTEYHLMVNRFENFMIAVATDVWPVEVSKHIFPPDKNSRLSIAELNKLGD